MANVRIYIPPEEIYPRLTISSPESVHKMRDVLSLGAGEEVNVFDGEGTEYRYLVSSLRKREVILIQGQKTRQSAASVRKLTAAFPLLADSKVSFILQKATELGVDSFVPFISSRSMRFTVSASKLKRWQKITVEASRQSGRLWVPRVRAVLPFNELVKLDYPLKLYGERRGGKLSEVAGKDPEDTLLVTGPEGGLSNAEIKMLTANNFNPVSLGANILRAETACIFASGLIAYSFNFQR